jgi:hypothetical protein
MNTALPPWPDERHAPRLGGTYVTIAVILTVVTALEFAVLIRATPILVPLLLVMSGKFAGGPPSCTCADKPLLTVVRRASAHRDHRGHDDPPTRFSSRALMPVGESARRCPLLARRGIHVDVLAGVAYRVAYVRWLRHGAGRGPS